MGGSKISKRTSSVVEVNIGEADTKVENLVDVRRPYL